MILKQKHFSSPVFDENRRRFLQTAVLGTVAAAELFGSIAAPSNLLEFVTRSNSGEQPSSLLCRSELKTLTDEQISTLFAPIIRISHGWDSKYDRLSSPEDMTKQNDSNPKPQITSHLLRTNGDYWHLLYSLYFNADSNGLLPSIVCNLNSDECHTYDIETFMITLPNPDSAKFEDKPWMPEQMVITRHDKFYLYYFQHSDKDNKTRNSSRASQSYGHPTIAVPAGEHGIHPQIQEPFFHRFARHSTYYPRSEEEQNGNHSFYTIRPLHEVMEVMLSQQKVQKGSNKPATWPWATPLYTSPEQLIASLSEGHKVIATHLCP